jgi:hypothetical protein
MRVLGVCIRGQLVAQQGLRYISKVWERTPHRSEQKAVGLSQDAFVKPAHIIWEPEAPRRRPSETMAYASTNTDTCSKSHTSTEVVTP